MTGRTLVQTCYEGSTGDVNDNGNLPLVSGCQLSDSQPISGRGGRDGGSVDEIGENIGLSLVSDRQLSTSQPIRDRVDGDGEPLRYLTQIPPHVLDSPCFAECLPPAGGVVGGDVFLRRFPEGHGDTITAGVWGFKRLRLRVSGQGFGFQGIGFKG